MFVSKTVVGLKLGSLVAHSYISEDIVVKIPLDVEHNMTDKQLHVVCAFWNDTTGLEFDLLLYVQSNTT